MVVFGTGLIGFVWYYFSPKYLAVGYTPAQPINFSHQLHAGELGLDCKYCHSTVEKTSFAALPSTATCMGCHNKVLSNSPRLALVRESFANKTPIPWVHVYSLPRYAHFDHNAHLSAGVGCISCHGRIDKMEVVSQTTPLSMGWCLECHRNPVPNLRPKGETTNMLYDPLTPEARAFASAAHSTGLIQPPQSCGACHY